MARKQTIAITGATGFLGQHLVNELLQAGYKVKALIRSPEKIAANWAQDPKFDVTIGDLSSNLSEWLSDADQVIHIAGLIKARTRQEFMCVNRDGSAAIAKAAEAANIKKIILVSSMAAREPHLSDYAASKRAGEDAIRKAFTGNFLIIRPPAVFGPKDKATKPIFDMINSGWLPVAGLFYKKKYISMVYVKDLTSYIVMQLGQGYGISNIETPATIKSMNWLEFAKFSSEAVGKPVRLLPIPMIVLYPFAAITSVTLRLFGLGHMSLQKLREFRHPDWTSEDEVDNPTPMIDALRDTATSYRKK